ncbi:thiamine phosphate synthase [Parasphingorhabdus halotolerans]|nr:thiamine phosphate synthase [Parasphingorhabdus halotolerans]
MTDARNDSDLEDVIKRLPRGSGIIFRHYHLDASPRKARFLSVQAIAKTYGHLIFLAGAPQLARAWNADGVHSRDHNRSLKNGLLCSAPVHNMREINAAKRSGADIILLSPVAKTRSHLGKPSLNRLQLRHLIGFCDKPVVLLGGMDRDRFRHYADLDTHGWAAIDGLR